MAGAGLCVRTLRSRKEGRVARLARGSRRVAARFAGAFSARARRRRRRGRSLTFGRETFVTLSDDTWLGDCCGRFKNLSPEVLDLDHTQCPPWRPPRALRRSLRCTSRARSSRARWFSLGARADAGYADGRRAGREQYRRARARRVQGDQRHAASTVGGVRGGQRRRARRPTARSRDRRRIPLSRPPSAGSPTTARRPRRCSWGRSLRARARRAARRPRRASRRRSGSCA